MDRVLGTATCLGELGQEVAPGLHEAELLYLMRERGFSTVEMGAINGSAFALNAA